MNVAAFRKLKEEAKRIRRCSLRAAKLLLVSVKRLIFPHRTFETITLGLFSAVCGCLLENSHVILHRIGYKCRQEPEEKQM